MAILNKLAEFPNYVKDLCKFFQQMVAPFKHEFAERFNFIPNPIQNLRTFAINDFEIHIIPKDSIISFITTHAQPEDS